MELTFNAQTISDLVAYSQILHKSGMFKQFSSAEEIFVVIEAGRENGIAPFKALECVRIENGSVMISGQGGGNSSLPSSEEPQAEEEPEPVQVSSSVQSAIAAAANSTTVELKKIKQELDTAPSNPYLQPHEMDDESAIETYIAWIEQCTTMKQLDGILFRLKFEESRESVKSAVRAAFKQKNDELKAQEVAQNSAEPFRSEPVVQADDHQDMAVLPSGDTIHQQENHRNAEEQHTDAERDRRAAAKHQGQAVDNTNTSEAKHLVESMRKDIASYEYFIPDNEADRIIQKINKCSTPEELYAAAEPIFNYYQKKDGVNLSPILDKLCAARLKFVMDKKKKNSTKEKAQWQA